MRDRPLPKANQTGHLRKNIAVFDFEIDADDMAQLAELNDGYSVLGRRPHL